MKIRKLISLRNAFIIATSAALTLGSCSSLTSAAKQGDIATVRQEIAAGVPVAKLNQAAEAAFSNGHTNIVDELIKAGAVPAPDNMLGTTLLLQNSETSPDEQNSYERPDISLSSFNVYWAIHSLGHVWGQDNETSTPCPGPWRADNTIQVTEEGGSGFDMYDNHHEWQYKRSDFNKAFIVAKHVHNRISISYDYVTYYELTFETPTSGTFRAIERETMRNGTEVWKKGRFWLKSK